ncbi:hypothetical protein [Marinoscillum sp. 108]|uniref:hypothetical protein n=1 Tax=Marinoscillum sp. 108 TaxID=2653151 RepID=UPI0012F2D331|nr:hypothetical protein [Marinoscillum sp. 108]VXD10706.1 conserved hypothetical protein [Marinoscillum sp. 108]
MNRTIITFLTLAILSCKTKETTEIIVIGTLHQPEANFNSEILFKILEEVKPDFILLELDSNKFTADFRLKEAKENELLASKKYQEYYPDTQLRPYEFEDRNQYRIDKGMRPTDGLTLRLVDSLYHVGLLTTAETEIFKTYKETLEPLKILAAKSPENFNNPTTDSLCERRQYYQYEMIPKITNVRDEFDSRFLIKPNGERISYRDGYQLWADFWDLRNQTMAKNIMVISEQSEGKKIVVLCGFMHRYYILSELKQLTHGTDITLNEYYEL